MKFLCDACSRLVELRAFVVREGALVVTCPECRRESRVPAPSDLDRKPAPVLELARPKPLPVGPLCPKCGAPHAEDVLACVRCGVVFALFKPENLALPPALEARWQELEKAWQDLDLHAAFVTACAGADALTEAARRYRIKADLSHTDLVAARFRDETTHQLMALASLPLKREGAEPSSEHASLKIAIVAGFLIVGLVIVFAALRYVLQGVP